MQLLSQWKLTKRYFDKKLKTQGIEHPEIISLIDNFFKKKRGFSFTMPTPKSTVILLVSGGIDSTVAWGLLTKIYGLRVYPLFTNRGNSFRVIRERQALLAVTRFMKATCDPNLFVEPFFLDVNSVPANVRSYYRPNRLHPKELLDNFERADRLLENDSNVELQFTNGVSPYVMSMYGATYAQMLYRTRRIRVNNIFLGVNASDRILVPSQSFTAIRSLMLSISVATNNFKWVVGSPFLERELGHYFNKQQVIQLGAALGVPLEKTWSCYRSWPYHCGNACGTCIDRRYSFQRAKVPDKTVYMSDITNRIRNFYGRGQKLLTKLTKRRFQQEQSRQ
jgi:7-cyano-7-deazaguanine synthase in queuosine biosynthesis